MTRGFCKYTDYLNGSMGLYDIAKMNDVIDILDENQARAYAVQRERE